jgi:hypothetical protein
MSKSHISASSTVVDRHSDGGKPKPTKSLLRRDFLNPMSLPVAMDPSKEASGMAPPLNTPTIRVFDVDLNTGLAPRGLPRP